MLLKNAAVMFESTTITGFHTAVSVQSGGILDAWRYPPAGGDRTITLQNGEHGILVTGNSRVDLNGVQDAPVVIRDNLGTALQVTDLTSMGIHGPVTVSNNGWDVRCDPLSVVSGEVNIIGLDPAKVDCPNLR